MRLGDVLILRIDVQYKTHAALQLIFRAIAHGICTPRLFAGRTLYPFLFLTRLDPFFILSSSFPVFPLLPLFVLLPPLPRYLKFTSDFENKFLSQGPYEQRNVFESLDLAWELLRRFPKKQLKKIPDKIADMFWQRRMDEPAPPSAAEMKESKDNEQKLDNAKP